MIKVGPRVSSLANEWAPIPAGAMLDVAGWRFRVTEVGGPELVRSRLPFTFEDVDGEENGGAFETQEIPFDGEQDVVVELQPKG